VSLRVGFDLDGVLANFRAAFRAVALDVLRRDVDGENEGAMSPQDIDRVWKRIGTAHNWWTTVSAYEPSQIPRLYTMAREARWEVVFLTKRPPSGGETVQIQTQWWLEQLGYFMPAVITVPGSRGELANSLRLDLLVDDQLINCADVIGASTSKAVLLLRAGEPPALRDHALARGIGVVSTLEEAIDIVARLQEVLPKRRGRVLRLMDWFPGATRQEPLQPRQPRPAISAADTQSSPSSTAYASAKPTHET
jgi:hypothetical protein